MLLIPLHLARKPFFTGKLTFLQFESVIFSHIIYFYFGKLFYMSSSILGCMYSMAAFGPVLGFLLGAYLLSFHMDSFSKIISIGMILLEIYNSNNVTETSCLVIPSFMLLHHMKVLNIYIYYCYNNNNLFIL